MSERKNSNAVALAMAASAWALLLLPATTARAVVTSWNTNSNGTFTTASNWSNGFPGLEDTAVFARGVSANYTVTFPGTHPGVGSPTQYFTDRLVVGFNTVSFVQSQQARYHVANPAGDAVAAVVVGEVASAPGVLNLWFELTASDAVIGLNELSVGTVNVNSGTFNVIGDPFVGGRGKLTVGELGIGRMTVSFGTVLHTDGQTILGNSAESDGTLNVSAGTFTTPAPGFQLARINVVVGNFGTGTMNVTGGGTVDNGSFAFVGLEAGSEGQITVGGAGSSLTSSALNIGQRGSGRLRIEAGGSVNAGANGARLGIESGSTGNLTVTGPGSTLSVLSINNGLVVGTGGSASARVEAGGTIVTHNTSVSSGVAVVTGAGSQWNATDIFTVGDAFSATAGSLQVSDAGSVVVGQGLTLHQAPSNSILVDGGSLTAGSFVNDRTFTQTSGSSSLGPVTGVGSLQIDGGVLLTSHVRQSSLSITGGTVMVNPDGTAAGTSMLASLAISDGKLGLADNDLIINYADGSTSPELAIRDLVKAGRVDGSTTGIFSTPGATRDNVLLAVVDNADWGQTSYNGIDVDTSTVIGKYTYFGDANLDGKVTGDDYVSVDSNLGTGNSWIEGDFNMDGRVSGDDYVAIDSNLGSGTADPLAFAELKAEMVALHVEMFGEGYLAMLAEAEADGFAVVPEPSAGLITIAMACGLLRRWQRNG